MFDTIEACPKHVNALSMINAGSMTDESDERWVECLQKHGFSYWVFLQAEDADAIWGSLHRPISIIRELVDQGPIDEWTYFYAATGENGLYFLSKNAQDATKLKLSI